MYKYTYSLHILHCFYICYSLWVWMKPTPWPPNRRCISEHSPTTPTSLEWNSEYIEMRAYGWKVGNQWAWGWGSLFNTLIKWKGSGLRMRLLCLHGDKSYTLAGDEVNLWSLLLLCQCSNIGDEWLVTENDTESYIPDVTEVGYEYGIGTNNSDDLYHVTTITNSRSSPGPAGNCEGGEPDCAEGSPVLCCPGPHWRQWEASVWLQGGEDWA